ncbi:MAG: hypothetical protein HYY25_17160 [Candidatus Wallbacteria bacterium]|nr:hypothetical protein [Candidatus Wallbacteria bacterium]MBI4865685.1 hypothetical protein [Candidatus Wallbacteria bacterium]
MKTIRILAGITLVSSLMAAPALAQEVDMASYLPLKVNNTWHYVDTAGGNAEFDLKVSEQVAVSGAAAFKTLKTGSPDWDIMSNDAAGLRLHKRNDKNGTIDWAPGVKFAAPRAKVGDVQTTTPNFTNPATGNKMLWTAKFEKLTDVTVPAGTFKSCVQLRITIQDSVLGTKFANFDMFLAPGVGIVKRQGQFFGVFFAQLLQRFSVL